MRYFPKHLALLLIAAAFFPACAAQIKIKTPTVAAISPEALGGLGNFEFGGGYAGSASSELSSNAGAFAPDVTTPKVIETDRIFAQLGVGLFRKIDFYFDPGAWSHLKLQLIGDSFAEAKAENFSLALLGGFSWKNDEGSGSDLDFVKDKGLSVSPNIRYSLRATQWKAGALAGFRLADPILFYAGANHQEHRYSGSFDNVAGRDGRFAGRVVVKSVNAGFEFSFNKVFVIRLEDAYTVSRIPHAGAKSADHFVGFYFAGIIGKKQ